MSTAKFGRVAAERWSEDAYADPGHYLGHRADLVRELGPALVPGDVVLDLACGDGGLASFLHGHGLSYLGVDASAAMVASARARLPAGAEVVVGDLNRFRPRERVAATTIFRALYYATDRPAFFRHVAGYTEKKLVFDVSPRRFRLAELRAELRAAGLRRLDARPFFVPQTVALPAPLLRALVAAERVSPLARCALRFRFTYVCAASR